MTSSGRLFNCIIANEVLMQLQERDPLPLSSHESHVNFSTDWVYGITQRLLFSCCSSLQTCLMSSCLVHCTSPSITVWEHIHSFLCRQVLIFCDYLFSRDGGAAAELRGLFIIPLTSWIRAAIITWAWIFMRWGSMRVWERLTSKNRQKGRATNSSLQTHSQKANTMQTLGGKRAKYRNTFLTCCYCFGEIMESEIWLFFNFKMPFTAISKKTQ